MSTASPLAAARRHSSSAGNECAARPPNPRRLVIAGVAKRRRAYLGTRLRSGPPPRSSTSAPPVAEPAACASPKAIEVVALARAADYDGFMDAREIFDAYFNFFAEQERTVFVDYANAALWTLRATTALVHVGLKAFPGEVTAKGHSARNPWGRSEYLTLDVMIADPNSWASPLFVAEHENSPSVARLQYDAWKLLSVESRRRVLVAYFGRGTEFKDFAALSQAVRDVCEGQPGKDILLIGGQADALPTEASAFQKAHETTIVSARAR